MIMNMVNNSKGTSAANLQLTWQAIFWRLLLTLLLLLALAGPGLAIFDAVTAKPDSRILPTTLPQKIGADR